MKKYLLGLIPLVMLGIAGCATNPISNTSVSETSAHAQTPKFTMVSSSQDVTVTALGQAQAPVGTLESYAGYFLLKVKITNNSNQVYHFSSSDFYLDDGNGNLENSTVTPGEFITDHISGFGRLTPGGSVTGFLGFRMPSSIDHITLYWNPTGVGGNYKHTDVSYTPIVNVNYSNGS